MNTRLEQMEAALRKIIEHAPTTEPEYLETDNHGESYSNGAERTHFYLAEIAREALNE